MSYHIYWYFRPIWAHIGPRELGPLHGGTCFPLMPWLQSSFYMRDNIKSNEICFLILYIYIYMYKNSRETSAAGSGPPSGARDPATGMKVYKN